MTSIWAEKPELNEQLKELWTEGLSASQIARKLSNGLTRNAVIGRVTRMGLNANGNHPRKARTATPRASP